MTKTHHSKQIAFAAALVAFVCAFSPVFADPSPFRISTSYLSDTSSKISDPAYLSRIEDDQRSTSDAAVLEGRRRQTALLIDGAYDFHYDADEESPVRPFLSGGIGIASQGTEGSGSAIGGAAVPVARLGGGVAYRLDSQWNLALNYQAGFASTSPTDPYVSTRPIDLQSLNLGMKYRF